MPNNQGRGGLPSLGICGIELLAGRLNTAFIGAYLIWQRLLLNLVPFVTQGSGLGQQHLPEKVASMPGARVHAAEVWKTEDA